MYVCVCVCVCVCGVCCKDGCTLNLYYSESLLGVNYMNYVIRSVLKLSNHLSNSAKNTFSTKLFDSRKQVKKNPKNMNLK